MENLISKNIFYIWLGSETFEKMRENIENIKNLNPSYKVICYDNTMGEGFLKENFEEKILNSYRTLVPFAYKSDLLRYCLLYTYGGIYMDPKISSENLFSFSELEDKEYFARDLESSGKGIYNGFMMCRKNNEKLLRVIHKICENCENRCYGNEDNILSALEITGPILLVKYFTDEEMNTFELEVYKVDNQNVFIRKNKEKNILYVNQEIYYTQHYFSKHYTQLWMEKNIYN